MAAPMSRYAEGTSVPVEKSRAEIEANVKRFGADAFSYGDMDGQAWVMFRKGGRFIRLTVHKPTADEVQANKANRLAPVAMQNAIDREERRRWRSLAALVKAKIVAVDDGIVEFNQEFMGATVMPDGQTVYQHAEPMIAQTYLTGAVQALLPPPPRSPK